MTLIKISRSAVHDLKRIVGKPKDDDVKAIHAVIRAMNVVAHLPTFYNPDLSMQLSQHLFSAQMAEYQVEYSTSLLPGNKSVYTPPTLPSHIPGTLNKVVGTPSKEDIKSAQNAVRTADGLAIYFHLFDADLNTKLSQHLFNLQFARYMHDSAQGNFASDDEIEEPIPVPQPTHESQEIPGVDLQVPYPSDHEQTSARIPQPASDPVPGTFSELTQLEGVMKEMKDAMKESTDTLKDMNQMLTLIKRDQSSTYSSVSGRTSLIRKDPLNQQCIAASEYGLPQLHFLYNPYDKISYNLRLNSDQIARYLKFFNIGADLLQDGEEPKLISGKEEEGKKLILAHVGFA
ncbi:unnamed protein product [Rhizoctonia solani]|uniref:Laminin domain protein n=1 Tax=Rhizoctonia solani TaxID=456999 RepID=A0A8H3CZS2_9AGAM|nr:unnamed protein product [Rhizoctonia solani]